MLTNRKRQTIYNMHHKKTESRSLILPEDIKTVKKLWLGYLFRGNDKMPELCGVHPYNPKEAMEEDMLKNLK